MANRALTVKETTILYKAHGCRVEFNHKTSYLKVFRDTARPPLYWVQHCHKGLKDRFDPITVGKGRRRLGFDTMSDEEFYKPLD